MLWGCLAALLLLPVIAIGKLIVYAFQGGLPRRVRCPACTQMQDAPHNRPDYDCQRCGTPVLRGGQFVMQRHYHG